MAAGRDAARAAQTLAAVASTWSAKRNERARLVLAQQAGSRTERASFRLYVAILFLGVELIAGSTQLSEGRPKGLPGESVIGGILWFVHNIGAFCFP